MKLSTTIATAMRIQWVSVIKELRATFRRLEGTFIDGLPKGNFGAYEAYEEVI